MIAPVKPPVAYRHYSNRASQGSLISQTSNWPSTIPPKHHIGSHYVDRMSLDDGEKWAKFIELMKGASTNNCGLNSLVERADDEGLIAAASFWFEEEVTAVRWVYFFNVASGYDCQRIDFIYTDPNHTRRQS